LSHDSPKIQETAVYQRFLIESACKVLKWDGIMVYSTCTVTEQGNFYKENQENISWAIEKLPLVLLEQDLYIGERSYPYNLTQTFSPLVFTGFFIALLKKTQVKK
jgi:16S rRNA C967 or C1407 C5-methylase (RsmB/RsmF family)